MVRLEGRAVECPDLLNRQPFPHFDSSPEIIRLGLLMHVQFPLSLRNVEDLLAEREIDIRHETVRKWMNRFGPKLAKDVRRQRVSRMRGFRKLSGTVMMCT